jgi:hypothetical protein
MLGGMAETTCKILIQSMDSKLALPNTYETKPSDCSANTICVCMAGDTALRQCKECEPHFYSAIFPSQ